MLVVLGILIVINGLMGSLYKAKIPIAAKYIIHSLIFLVTLGLLWSVLKMLVGNMLAILIVLVSGILFARNIYRHYLRALLRKSELDTDIENIGKPEEPGLD